MRYACILVMLRSGIYIEHNTVMKASKSSRE